MRILKVSLTDGQPESEIKISRIFIDQSCVWSVEVNGILAVITRDDTGIWMQHSSNNLSPEILLKVGQAIESMFNATDRTEL
jgi:hypothetical protein